MQLTNNTVQRNIHDLSAHIKKKLRLWLKRSFAFSLQIDKLAELSGLSVVLVFVRYLFQNRTEQENLLSEGAVLKLVPFPTTYLRSWVFEVCSNKI